MTNLADHGGIVPQFEMRHRLALALEHADVSVAAMADELGLNRNTIGNYLSGRTVPNRAVMRIWALRTGVPLAWLLTGGYPTGDGGAMDRRGHLGETPDTGTATTRYLLAVAA